MPALQQFRKVLIQMLFLHELEAELGLERVDAEAAKGPAKLLNMQTYTVFIIECNGMVLMLHG